MPEKCTNVSSRVFCEVFEEPVLDLNRIRPTEQLWFMTMKLGGVIGELEPVQLDVLSYRFGLRDGGIRTASEVAILLGMEVAFVESHYAEGLRKIRAHSDVQRMRPYVRAAAVK